MRVLTGINTTGTLHLGNYCGAIRPCVQASRRDDVESFFFMADLHALIKCQDPDRIEKSRMQIAASWLACGLDPDRVTFYRQSDIPEIPMLNWMLNCVCSKGLMNRAHAYKAYLEANESAGEDPDAGVFHADRVPVGRDQIQHLEMARDMATRFNNTYGNGKEFFVLPFEQVDENVELLPGLDGRKMSKSYNNVIPLFDGGEKALRDAIGRVVTDSKMPGEPKDPDSTSLTRIYEAFATREEYEAFRQELRDGLGWGEAKKKLIDKINSEIGPMREKYEYYVSHPAELEAILQAGAAKARKIAAPFLEELKHAVGLRTFRTVSADSSKTQEKAQVKPLGVIKQYRESDGLFYFKLTEGAETLLTSKGYENGRDAGLAVGKLKAQGFADTASVTLSDGVTVERVNAVLQAMRAADEEKKRAKAARQ